MLFLNDSLQQIEAAEHRIHFHHDQLQRRKEAQHQRLERTATRPSALLSVFAAGYIFDWIRPRWRTVSTGAGLAFTMYRYQGLIQTLFGAGRD